MSPRAAALAVRRLVVGHGQQAVLTVDELVIPAGQWWALVGPNGCGKTTLLDTVAGRCPSLAGDIFIDGHSLKRAPKVARAALGFVLTPEALPPRLTLRECLDVFTAVHARLEPAPAVATLLETWSLGPWIDTHVDRCSLGVRQKLGVLLALVGAPRLLVMDESFNGLDPASGLALKAFLDAAVSAGEFSVLLATHALDLVEQHADTALLIDQGRILARMDRDELRAHRGHLDQHLAGLQAPAR